MKLPGGGISDAQVLRVRIVNFATRPLYRDDASGNAE